MSLHTHTKSASQASSHCYIRNWKPTAQNKRFPLCIYTKNSLETLFKIVIFFLFLVNKSITFLNHCLHFEVTKIEMYKLYKMLILWSHSCFNLRPSAFNSFYNFEMASGAYVTTNISFNLKNVFFEKPLSANKALSKASFSKLV